MLWKCFRCIEHKKYIYISYDKVKLVHSEIIFINIPLYFSINISVFSIKLIQNNSNTNYSERNVFIIKFS